MIELRAGAATDVGLVRTTNQDELLVAGPLFAVADGMGGAAAGEVASVTAIQALEEAFADATRPRAQDLTKAVQSANRAVWLKAEGDPALHGMGTTLVALARVDGDRLAIANVGDSRLYGFRAGELRQITSDHNLMAELVAEGRLSPEEAEYHPRRNIITRALGVDPTVTVDLFIEDIRAGDRFLLCSDGLSREVKDDQIASLLRRLGDPDEAARELVAEAKRQGGSDNVTVVVVDVVETDVKDETSVVPAATGLSQTLAAPAPEPPRQPTARFLTLRVVIFIVVFFLLIAGAAAGTAWYARSSYFVGLQGQELTVFKGRPGGVFIWKPTVANRTGVITSEILPRHIPDLQSGVEESSESAAIQYVGSLVLEKDQSEEASQPPGSTTATTTPSSSTTPATTA